MKSNIQKGFVVPLVLFVMALLAAGGTYYVKNGGTFGTSQKNAGDVETETPIVYTPNLNPSIAHVVGSMGESSLDKVSLGETVSIFGSGLPPMSSSSPVVHIGSVVIKEVIDASPYRITFIVPKSAQLTGSQDVFVTGFVNTKVNGGGELVAVKTNTISVAIGKTTPTTNIPAKPPVSKPPVVTNNPKIAVDPSITTNPRTQPPTTVTQTRTCPGGIVVLASSACPTIFGSNNNPTTNQNNGNNTSNPNTNVVTTKVCSDGSVVLTTSLCPSGNIVVINGAAYDGVTDDTAPLKAAISSIGSASKKLFIAGPLKISSDVVFPSNIIVSFAVEGVIVGTSGREQVTFGSVPDASLHQIFRNIVPLYSFGGTTYPEWFGAKGDGSSDDRIAIQLALNSLVNRGVVKLASKTYAISDHIDIKNSYVSLQGDGQNISRIVVMSPVNSAVIVSGQPGASVSGAYIGNLGISRNQVSSGGVGITLYYTAVAKVENVHIADSLIGISFQRATNTIADKVLVTFSGPADSFVGFDLNGSGVGPGGNASSVIRDCWVDASGGTGKSSIGLKGYGSYVSDLEINSLSTASTNYGIYLDFQNAELNGNQDVKIINPIIDYYTTQGIFINKAVGQSMVTISNGWIDPKPTYAETDAIYIVDSRGVTINGTQFTSQVAQYKYSFGVKAINSQNITVTGGQFVNQYYGVYFDRVTNSSVYANRFYNPADQPASNQVSVLSGSNVSVNSNTFDGYVTTALYFDAQTSNGVATGNTFNTANIQYPFINPSTNSSVSNNAGL
jgi:hypothetical protein